ncbi:MAG: type II toxin-antitoxin system RelE/ParE family toxin [Verrucomicrobiota bacterium]|jgi:plasmid stabilization system protein ParE
MNDFLIAPEARFDLDEIWSYYAIDLQNPDTADRARDELFGALRKLARTPGIGHFRSDLAGEPLRFWRVRSYLIICRGEKRPIEIVRVPHGARDVQAILGREGAHDEPED